MTMIVDVASIVTACGAFVTVWGAIGLIARPVRRVLKEFEEEKRLNANQDKRIEELHQQIVRLLNSIESIMRKFDEERRDNDRRDSRIERLDKRIQVLFRQNKQLLSNDQVFLKALLVSLEAQRGENEKAQRQYEELNAYIQTQRFEASWHE